MFSIISAYRKNCQVITQFKNLCLTDLKYSESQFQRIFFPKRYSQISMSSLNILMYQTILPFLSRQKQQFSICIIFQSRKIPCSYIEVKNKQLSQFCYLTHDIKSCIPEKSSCTRYNIAAFVSAHSHPESVFDKHIYEIGEYHSKICQSKTFFIFSIFISSISFCLQKPVHYFIIHQKILHIYKDLHPQ